MQRDKTLVPLSHDHYHGLRLAQNLKKNSPPSKDLPSSVEAKIKYAEEFYKTDLILHFKSEEAILFPYVKGVDPELDEICARAIREHRLIKESIDGLKGSSDPVEDMDKLGRLLTEHIRIEERELFPRIQALLPEEKLHELDGKINAVRKDEKPGK